MENLLVRLLGWKATILHGDPAVADRWRWLRRYLARGQARTLDAGCGSGAFTMYAASVGNEAVGLSFDARNMRLAKERAQILGLGSVRFIEADLRKLDQLAPELGQFDQVICFETIEHIMNDTKLVTDLSRLLKPGGKLLLTTPYSKHHALVDECLSPCEDGGHVRWGYSHEQMRELLREVGLSVQVEEFISGFVSQQLINLANLLSRKIQPRIVWAMTFPLRLLKVGDGAATRLLRYPHLCIGVVAVKLE